MLKKTNHQSRLPAKATTPASVPLMPADATQSLLSGMDFVKSFWGSLPESVPGFVVPTLDVDELDKRITDLRVVEAWLAVNSSLLRTTIQSLEVQRNTIAAIQSFGGSFAGVTQGPLHDKKKPNSAAPDGPPRQPVAPGARSTPNKTAAVGMKAAGAEPAVPEDAGHDASGPDPQTVFGRSAAAWLGVLEDQFTRLVSTALASGLDSNACSKPMGVGATASASPLNPKRPRAKRTTAKSKRRAA